MKSNFIQSKSFNYAIFSKYIDEAVKTNQWSNYGWAVKELEERARHLLKIDGTKAIIATNSGTSALHAIVYGMRKYDNENHRVTTQNFTFPSASLGPCAGPIVVDFDGSLNLEMRDSFLVDYGKIIIVTNCFGHLQNIDHIIDQATKLDKYVIFDNAATPYSFYNEYNSCNYGNAAFISLHHTKPIGFGEGGLVIVDRSFEDSVREAINFGYDEDRNFDERSSNFKMSEIAAAGILQWWDQFDINEMVKTYQDNYYKAHYKLMVEAKGEPYPNHSDGTFLPFLLPWVYFDPVEEHQSSFENVTPKKYYKPLRFNDPVFPNTNHIYERILCYPIHGDITYD